MSMEDRIIFDIRADLSSIIDEKTKNGFQRFFKEEVKFYGVKTPDAERIAKKHFEKLRGKSKGEVFRTCEKLLQSGFHEEAIVAFAWAYSFRKQYEADDFSVFERWVERYVDNWAKCDTLCNHSVGALVESFPQCTSGLKAWTKSDNRWLRRASAVSLIIPAKKGMFLDNVFVISSNLLKDKDDLVQKGYGWLLKEASNFHQNEVFEYVMKNKADMPRTALRYAIEKLPKDLRDAVMKK